LNGRRGHVGLIQFLWQFTHARIDHFECVQEPLVLGIDEQAVDARRVHEQRIGVGVPGGLLRLGIGYGEK
jgi:hypothetical protein